MFFCAWNKQTLVKTKIFYTSFEDSCLLACYALSLEKPLQELESRVVLSCLLSEVTRSLGRKLSNH